ncbi:carotenoid 1,2-hydratase [Vibrio sp. JPW-9-11-11]|nr:lipocalin-like domain-containing protein [Vibrio sp. JPW-9-11-11]NVD06769.1 carotenoid 1,2-hydratase [Vibrio sp. JPW-9-11-11]
MLNHTDRDANPDGLGEVMRTNTHQVFEPVLPDNPVVVPRDFSFQYEFQHGWWHFFANVVDQKGERYAIQWSYFRIANHDTNLKGWLNPQLYIANVVISNQDKVWRDQRVARGGIGQAGMTQKPFKLWIDNWYWRSLGTTPFPGALNVETEQLRLDLQSTTRGPLVVPGERGYVKKHNLLPVASHSITAPFLSVRGEIQLGQGNAIQVQGQAWMSKEWGSGLLAEGQQGWDWLVLNLDNETTLSVNRYRHDMQMPYLFGTLATSNGKTVSLDNDQLTMQPISTQVLKNGKEVPVEWQVLVPDQDINVTVRAVNHDLWLPFVIPYWEGPVTAFGSHQAQGFMQMTGY